MDEGGSITLKLCPERIEERMQEVTEWQREEKKIVRRYRFPSFPEAIHFVNRVAEIAEARSHHPFIAIDYKFVTLTLTSWHEGGLTDKDFDEAKAFDEAYAEATG